MEQIRLTVADGTQMQATVSTPKQKSSAAVIVLQEAFGVNDHIKDLTRCFAEAGYIAIAPELYHRTAAPGFVCGYTTFQTEAMPHFSAMTDKGIQQDVQACYDWLLATHKSQCIAAIGYCMGGRAAFVANASTALSCAISYYGGRIAANNLNLAPEQKSPLLFFWGGLDKNIPPTQIASLNQALTSAQKKFTCVEFSDADHGFFCDERPAYNEVAARQAWALTLQFLKEYNTPR